MHDLSTVMDFNALFEFSKVRGKFDSRQVGLIDTLRYFDLLSRLVTSFICVNYFIILIYRADDLVS